MNPLNRYYPVSLGRIFFLLAGMLSPAAAFPQLQDSVEVRAAQSLLDVGQGNVIAAGINVSNLSNRKKTFKGRVLLPAGWRSVTREGQFDLSPGQSDSRLISFSLPPRTPAGTYMVRYFLTDLAFPAREKEASFAVHIKPIRQLDVSVLTEPRFVKAGKVYQVRFMVVNSGNIAGTALLRSHSSESFRVTLDSVQLHLAPKERRTVTALVLTSGAIQNKVVSTVELTVWFMKDTTVMSRVSSVVDVIPQVSDVSDRFLQVPLEVTGRTSGEDDRLGGQIEILGAGSFTEDRSDRIGLMMRLPDIQSQSSIGLRDEYRVRYSSAWGDLQAGDWSYTLSPLTELNRYAFGGRAALQYDRVAVGGFFNRSRFVDNGQREAAGFLQYNITENHQVGVNYLRKQEQSDESITSVRGILKPLTMANLDLEYGVSSGAKGTDKAYALEISGKQTVIAYDLRLIRSGARYAGYYRDVDHNLMAVNVFPLENVRLEAYYRSEERNKDRDTTLFYAPRERFFQFGAGYSNLIALYFRSTAQKDLLPAGRYDRLEDMVQVRAGYGIGRADFHTNVDFGTAKDKLANKHYPFQRYALFANVSPAPAQNYSTSVEYTKERNLLDGSRQERVSASLGISFFINNYTNIQGNLYWSRSFSPDRQDFALLDVTLQHAFPFGHRIVVRARQNFSTPSINGRELAYSLQYSVPIGIPVKRLSSTGQLRGRVLDEKGGGVGNILINVGSSAAITDSDGEFFFPVLAPGQHYLVLDKATMGIDRVSMQITPMSIKITGGKESEVTINLARSSAVTGVVMLHAFDERDSSGTRLTEAGPMSGVFLELSNEKETLRRVSDSKGRFVFADLKPGSWILRVAGGDIPQYHEVEKDAFDVLLTPGSRKAIVFNIRPRKRTIRIVDEATVPTVSAQKDTLGVAPLENFLISYSSVLRGYVLQISSWETGSKAAEYARTAEEATGLKAIIERTDVSGLGTRYRVKIGPFETREKAEEFGRQWKEIEERR